MNNYHLYDPVGRGGSGVVVYKGRKKGTLEYVAVKSMGTDSKGQALKEVKLLHALQHPNILTFHTWYETSKHVWLILEYCVGGDLGTLMGLDGRVGEPMVLQLAHDLASALQHVHASGHIHCDLRPANVLLDEHGRARLTGFAHAQRFADASPLQGSSRPPGRLAPEMAAQAAPFSTASDLWALGSLLYECALGAPPPAKGLGSTPRLAGVSPQLAALLGRLLDPAPAGRAGWAEVCSHPVWEGGPLEQLPLPAEPALVAFLGQQPQPQGGSVTPVRAGPAPDSVEPLGHQGSGEAYGAERSMGDAGPKAGPPAQQTGRPAPGSSAPVPAASLLWHPADSVLKPVVGNRRIERLPTPVYRAADLPFRPWAASDVVAASQAALHAHVAHICDALTTAPPEGQLAALWYLAAMAEQPGAANALIHSDIGLQLLLLVRDAASHGADLAALAAHTFGLLARHASQLDAALGQAGALAVLMDGVRSAHPALRRRCMAALGELLFYVAAHPDAQRAAGEWRAGQEVVAFVVGCLGAGEDEVVQHYAAKTVENIEGQPGLLADHFCTAEAAAALAQIVMSAGKDAVRGTAASALCRVLHLCPALLPSLLDGSVTGFFMIARGLTDSSPRVQQAAVTMLSMLLENDATSPATQAAITRDVLVGLGPLLDSPAPILRAKALVALAFLCGGGAGVVAEVCDSQVLQQAEHCTLRDDGYAVAAFECFQQAVRSAAAGMLQEVVSTVRGGLDLDEVIALHMPVAIRLLGTSAVDGSSAVLGPAIVQLASLLKAASGGGLQDWQERAQFVAYILEAIDVVCSHEGVLDGHLPEVLDGLVPVLADEVACLDEAVDFRFLSLKLLCDILLHLTVDMQLAAEGDQGARAAAIRAAVVGHALPLMPALLEDEDPMPLYALKMLSVLVEAHVGLAAELAAMGLATQFFEWLAVDHPHNNVHNIRLCTAVVVAGALAATDLVEVDAAPRALAVMAYAIDRQVEPFVEAVLELCEALLQVKSAAAELLMGIPFFAALACHEEREVAAAAARCLAHLARQEPARTAAGLAEEHTIGALAEALEGCAIANLAQDDTCAALVHVLGAAWGLQDALKAAGLQVAGARLYSALVALARQSGDVGVQRGAAQLLKRFQQGTA